MKKYSEKQKQEIIAKVQGGNTITAVSRDIGIARSTIHSWLQQIELPMEKNNSILTRRQYSELTRRCDKYKNMIEILQSVDCMAALPLKDKLDVMDSLYGQYEVHTLCEALQVPTGTFYNHMLRGKHGDTLNAKRREELRIVVHDIFNEYHQLFGAGKITTIMRERGHVISEKFVVDLMREMGLQSVSTNSKREYTKWQKGENRNILQQQFYVKEPNKVWVSDITTFKYQDAYYYIAVIIDLFSRKVISYRVSKSGNTQLITKAFKTAYFERAPQAGLVFHSDRGAQYQSFAFNKLLRSLGIEQSFSRSGRPHDNAVMESFFSYLKKEELYRRKYESENQLLKGIDSYMCFYNNERPHGAIRYKTPTIFEKDFHTGICQ